MSVWSECISIRSAILTEEVRKIHALFDLCVCVCVSWMSIVLNLQIRHTDTNIHKRNCGHTRSTYISALQSAEPIFGSHLIIRTWEMCSRVPNPMTKNNGDHRLNWARYRTASHNFVIFVAKQQNPLLWKLISILCLILWYFVFPFRCLIIGEYVRVWMKYGLPANRVHRTIDDETVHTHTHTSTLAYSLWARENNVPEIVHYT